MLRFLLSRKNTKQDKRKLRVMGWAEFETAMTTQILPAVAELGWEHFLSAEEFETEAGPDFTSSWVNERFSLLKKPQTLYLRRSMAHDMYQAEEVWRENYENILREFEYLCCSYLYARVMGEDARKWLVRVCDVVEDILRTGGYVLPEVAKAKPAVVYDPAKVPALPPLTHDKPTKKEPPRLLTPEELKSV